MNTGRLSFFFSICSCTFNKMLFQSICDWLGSPKMKLLSAFLLAFLVFFTSMISLRKRGEMFLMFMGAVKLRLFLRQEE